MTAATADIQELSVIDDSMADIVDTVNSLINQTNTNTAKIAELEARPVTNITTQESLALSYTDRMDQVEFETVASYYNHIDRGSSRSIVLFADKVCTISGGSPLYIQFGNTTTVHHPQAGTDCIPGRNGDTSRVQLSTAQNEVFHKGDVLVLDTHTVDYVKDYYEIYREQSASPP